MITESLENVININICVLLLVIISFNIAVKLTITVMLPAVYLDNLLSPISTFL